MPFDSWQEGILLSGELARIPDDLVFARQQELFNAHRQLSGAFENLVREMFQATGFTPTERQIDMAFCEWAKAKWLHGNAGFRIQQWDKTMYSSALRETFNSPQGPGELSGRVINAVNLALQHKHLRVLGGWLNQLFDMDWHESGSGSWNAILSRFVRSDDCGFANTLLAGKLLFQIRNFLLHGYVDTAQPKSYDQGNVKNTDPQRTICLQLDAASLEYCFRLLIAVTASVFFHSKRIDEDSAELFHSFGP